MLKVITDSLNQSSSFLSTLSITNLPYRFNNFSQKASLNKRSFSAKTSPNSCIVSTKSSIKESLGRRVRILPQLVAMKHRRKRVAPEMEHLLTRRELSDTMPWALPLRTMKVIRIRRILEQVTLPRELSLHKTY